MASTLGWMRIILSDDFIIMKRNGMNSRLKTAVKQDDGPAPAVRAGADEVAQEAQCVIKGLGDDSQPTAELNERFEPGTVGFAVGTDGVDRLEKLGRFGTGEQAQAGIAAGVADGKADHVDWKFSCCSDRWDRRTARWRCAA